MRIERRVGAKAVALETTLLVHGVPRDAAPTLHSELGEIARAQGAVPALVGVVNGVPTVGMSERELAALLNAPKVEKANTSNLGVLIHRRVHAATTVSATMEIAAGAGLSVFATGGLGGLHHGLAEYPDISADLGAFTRFPIAVVTSGVKSLLNVGGTRELLETLGVTVVGFRTDRFPAFYLRESDARVDARFDDVDELAAFLSAELRRTGRGIVVCNPIPEKHELSGEAWVGWLTEAQRSTPPGGRDATPQILARLHELSGGATLRANLELVKSNAELAGMLAVRLADRRGNP